MADPIAVTIYDVNGLPVAGLLPTFVSPGYYKTATGVDAVAPSVTDGGDGDYVFTPTAGDLVTGIRWLIDGGSSAVPRFYAGTIESTASAQASTTTTVTGVNLFGVTPDLVKRRYFPQWNAFTTNGNPSLATCLELIDECAAELEGRLLQEGITAVDLTVSNAGAYLWCRRALRLMAAIEILTVSVQQAPPLSRKWQEQLDALWKELKEKGRMALGSGVDDPDMQPNGPTTHLDSYAIDVGDIAGDASTSVPRLRRDDDL